ncbi:ANTAR domain-containing protein [Isoptericola sp. CG 20/1183]|uniref:ANTAR domain-containing protein n=1 Tax=Isoptericola halotolerans TaxID=300560 RepID=A0ABX5E9A9_9MICO|nr:ANTAR domain-containing protein [Isoptericola sp. CG 20/1183]PRZ02998.1 ANTAR domain-containing protein [Isoptericola halotolerans]
MTAGLSPTELLGLLAQTLASADAEEPLAVRLCRAVVKIVDGHGGTLAVASVPGDRMVVSTSTTYAQIDALQELLGEGPVPQAIHDDRLVVARVEDSPNRFPTFAQEAAKAVGGPLTVYAVPMHAGVRTVGVLSLYLTSGQLSRGSADIQFLADAVGTSLMNDLDALDWSQKSHVHQATGMVTAQLRIHPDDALAVLRAHAFARSTDLQTVAEDVLARRMAFSHDRGKEREQHHEQDQDQEQDQPSDDNDRTEEP